MVTCASAGNGKDIYIPDGRPWYFGYPASYDHVISTTHIGNENCSWVGDPPGGSGLYCNEHNVIHGDTMSRHPSSPSVDLSAPNFNHNTRVDICAPAHDLGGITYVPSIPATDPGHFYTDGGLTGTSFASPMTAGVIGLMASVNPCLSPYQLEWLLKNSANPDIYSVADNAYYASPRRLGAGRLDAEKAVIEAYGHSCNNLLTQTFYIKGIEINTLCAPGFNTSNSEKPVLNPLLVNGTPPFTYYWQRIDQAGESAVLKYATLNSYIIASPTIIATAGTRVAFFYLTVYDASEIQKVAHQVVKVQLKTDNTYELASRDSYLDMFDEANSQAIVDPREIDFWASPDVWNRHANDGITTPQNVEYFSSGAPNYMHYRVRNVGCANYPATDNAGVHLHWTLASTGEDWAVDWEVANVPAAAGGTLPAGRRITTSGSLPVPNLAPGAEYIGSKEWYPVNPSAYAGSPEAAGICFLSRLVEPTKPLIGMAYSEVTHTTTNVRKNNNIVTRNMELVNLGRKRVPGIRGPIRTTRMYVGNSNDLVSSRPSKMVVKQNW